MDGGLIVQEEGKKTHRKQERKRLERGEKRMDRMYWMEMMTTIQCLQKQKMDGGFEEEKKCPGFSGGFFPEDQDFQRKRKAGAQFTRRREKRGCPRRKPDVCILGPAQHKAVEPSNIQPDDTGRAGASLDHGSGRVFLVQEGNTGEGGGINEEEPTIFLSEPGLLMV